MRTRLSASLFMAGLVIAACTQSDDGFAGAYESETGTVMNVVENVVEVTPWRGVTFDSGYVVDGDVIQLITFPDEDTECAGASGVYRFEQTVDGLVFTVVSEECSWRAAEFTAGPWSRIELGAYGE